MMAGKKAVLFNLWGVVLDSRTDDVFHKFEESHKLPRGFLSQITSRESSAMTKAERGELSLVQMIPEFEAECRAAAQAQGVCLPGNFSVTDLLDQFRETKPLHLSVLRTATVLHQHGLATAVLANQWVDDSASGDSGSRLLALLGGHFDLVLQSCRSGHRVPEPAMFNSSLQRLNVTPQQSMWLDVNEEGVNAAKAAGMAAILVTDVADALDKLSNFTGVEAVTENTVPPVYADELSHGYVTIKPGVRTHYVEVGTGPPVVLCHGLFEIWYSWSYQIQAIAAAGFRVFALDMKGSGESSAPTEIEEYSQQQLTQDLITFMDKMALPQVTLVGHDRQGLVWNMARFHPERVRAVASLSTPPFPENPNIPENPKVNPMDLIKANPIFDYQLYFQDPGVAEAEFERDLERTFKIIFVSSAEGRSPPDPTGVCAKGGVFVGLPDEVPRSSMLSEEALQYYVSQFKRNGFRGPLNWHRNIERNWRWKCSRPMGKLMMPALMVTAGKDPLNVPVYSRGMEEMFPNLTREHIEDCGLWINMEKPAELNKILISWLQDTHKTEGGW